MFNWSVTSTGRLEVIITSEVSTSGTVSVPGQGWSTSFNVLANSSTTVLIPNNIGENINNQVNEMKGVLIESLDTISVFNINYKPYTADGSIVYPVQSIGTEYRLTSYGGGAGSEFLIVATENGTQIEITPSTQTAGGNAANVPFIVNLNQGDSYQVRANGSGDLSGTTVRGTALSGNCRPFAVYSGNKCTNMPSNCTACDHIYEQELPVSVWGNDYYAVPFTPATSYSVKIVADQNNTQYLINGTTTGTLNAGASFFISNVTGPKHIMTSAPSSVTLFMEGMSCSNYGDPAMLFLNSVQQSIDKVTFSTVTSSIMNDHRLNVILKTQFTGQLLLDGASIPPFSFLPFPGGTGYSYAQLVLTPGSHTVEADSGFTAYVFGTGGFESYAYSVGSYSKEKPVEIDSLLCSGDTIHLGLPTPLYNAWWSIDSLPNDTIYIGNLLTLVPPIIPGRYLLHGNSSLTGCEVLHYFDVVVPDSTVLTITQDKDSICRLDKVQLLAVLTPNSNNRQFLWTPAAGLDNPNIANPIASPLTSTWYKVTSTPINGCGPVLVDSIFIFVLDNNISELNIYTNDSLLCRGETTSLNLNFLRKVFVESADPGIHNNLWSSNTSVASTACGTYIGNAMYFANAGLREAVTIPMNTLSGGKISFMMKFGSGAVPCDVPEAGENVIFSYSNNGGLSWNTIRTLYYFAYSTFTLVSVNIPGAALGGSVMFRWQQLTHSGANQDVWMIDDVEISLRNYQGASFIWSPAAGLSSANSSSPFATPVNTSWYALEFIDSVSGCIYIDSLKITVGDPFTLSIPSDTSLCGGSTLSLSVFPSAGTGHTYNWTPAAFLNNATVFNPVAQITKSTMFHVSVQSAEGCSAYDSVFVKLSNLSGISVAALNLAYCPGDSVQTTSTIERICGYNHGNVSGNKITGATLNANSISSNYAITPFCGSYKNSRRQYLILASELNAMGFTGPSVFTQLAFFTSGIIIPQQYEEITISLGCTGVSQMSNQFLVNLFPVYHASLKSIGNGKVNFSFNDFYEWDGVSNLVVDFCYSNSMTTPNISIIYGTTGLPFSIYFNSVSNQVCGSNSGNAPVYYRPKIELEAYKSSNSGISYTWSPVSGVSNPNIQNPVIAPAVSAIYTLTVIDSSSGCIYTDSIAINIVNPPFTVVASNDTIVCSALGLNLNVNISPANGYNVLWIPFTKLFNPNTFSPTVKVDGTETYYVVISDTAGCYTIMDSVHVMVPLALNLSLTADTSICEGTSVTLSATGGYSYNWSPAAGLSNPTAGVTSCSPQTPTQYFLTATDTFGCETTDSVFVDLIYIPNIDIGSDTTFCEGNNVVLDAGIGYLSYLWSNGDTTSSVVADSSGIYSVDVTHLCGVLSDSLQLTVWPNPMVDLGLDLKPCDGDTVMLSVSTSGVFYLWSTGATSANINALASGNYSLTVIDNNGCYGYDTVAINFHPIPYVDLGPDTAICFGAALVLDAGNPGSTFHWNNGSGLQTMSISSQGVYWVEVDNGYCKGVDSLALYLNPLPTALMQADYEQCEGDTVILNAGNPGGSYLWSTGQTQQTILVSQSGQYWVQITDPNGCIGYDTTLVDFSGYPLVSLGNDTAFCEGESIKLTVDPGYLNYLWSNASTTTTISVTTAGVYWVAVTNKCGTRTDTLQVTDIYPLPVVYLGPGGVLCKNLNAALDAGNTGSSFIWNTDEVTQTIIPQNTGFYSVLVTSEFGCLGSGDISIDLVNPPVIDLGSDTLLCYGDHITLDGTATYATYVWQDGANQAYYSVYDKGSYHVIVENMCGVGEDSVFIDFSDCVCELQVPNAFTPNNDGVNEVFRPFTYCEMHEYTLQIFNRWGQLVFTSADINFGWDGTFQGNPAVQDVYVYTLSGVSSINEHDNKFSKKGSVALLR